MKTKLTITLLILFTSATALFAAETKYIDGLTNSRVGAFPKGWRARPGQSGEAKKVYKVAEEAGNKYLASDDPNQTSVQIFKLANWNLEKYPLLKWKWRARKLPKGANESNPATNDSACGLYISFGILRGEALKYVWSTSAPTGKFIKKNDKMYIIVKRSGGGGNWANETVNLAEDAKKAFGKIPDRTLSGVAVLTDGNATHSAAACDYDSIGYASLPEGEATTK